VQIEKNVTKEERVSLRAPLPAIHLFVLGRFVLFLQDVGGCEV